MTSVKLHPDCGYVTRILLDSLSYVHPERMQLPSSFETPRHRAVVNQLLVDSLPENADDFVAQPKLPYLRLLQFWPYVPQACTLVGAQLLKAELAWQGRSLGLPALIRAFMDLPLHRTMRVLRSALPVKDMPQQFRLPADCETDDLISQIQGVGLSSFLDWQQAAPAGLIGRMQLMFPPRLDACFVKPRRQVHCAELFLISQALHYAKNHPNHA